MLALPSSSLKIFHVSLPGLMDYKVTGLAVKPSFLFQVTAHAASRKAASR